MRSSFLIAVVLAACANAPAPQVATQQSLAASTLGPGDVFEVRVFGEQDLSGAYRVASDGSIDFPLVGRVVVQGQSASDLSGALKEGLKRYVKQPEVSIFIKEFNSKKVFVFGQVQKPGTFTFEQGMNIIQAITLAGGFDKYANKDKSFVTREVSGREQRLSVSVKDISEGAAPNFPLEPGDIVYVPESLF